MFPGVRGGLQAANTLGEFLFFLGLLIHVCGDSGGFNFAKIASFDFRTDCNTFWIIFGTSNNVTKYRPSGPLIYYRNCASGQHDGQASGANDPDPQDDAPPLAQNTV